MHIVSKRQSDAVRPKMGALDVLPVFLDLKGKPVLVAGGEDAAAWKAELLAAAGAEVAVYAQQTGAEMEALLARGAATLRGADWREADWEGLALAVGDCAEKEAADFVAMARAHAVPVNVIDKPEFCQVQFGSIVNRSPLVVGISTSGAAPILGQAVRRKIETLLPVSLAGWARAAREIRAAIMEKLSPGAERRHFWERFCELAFAARPATLDAGSLIATARQTQAGRVILVGAGPGDDPEHLTLKAVRALQAADTIVYDTHLSPDVLELARREARRVPDSGEAGEMMIALAREGQHVVRLMSGDATGAGMAELEGAGIPVEVVPGVAAYRIAIPSASNRCCLDGSKVTNTLAPGAW